MTPLIWLLTIASAEDSKQTVTRLIEGGAPVPLDVSCNVKEASTKKEAAEKSSIDLSQVQVNVAWGDNLVTGVTGSTNPPSSTTKSPLTVRLNDEGLGQVSLQWAKGRAIGTSLPLSVTPIDAKHSEQLTCGITPSQLTLQALPPSVSMTYYPPGQVLAGQWLFKELSIRDEDDALKEVTLTIQSQAGTADTDWEGVLSLRETKANVNFSASRGVDNKSYTFRLLPGTNDTSFTPKNVQETLLSIQLTEAVRGLAGKPLTMTLEATDADGLKSTATLSMMITAHSYLSDVAVRTRLIEYPRDGQREGDPNAYTWQANETTVVRQASKLADVQVQSLIDPAELGGKHTVERVDLLIVNAGEPATDWSSAGSTKPTLNDPIIIKSGAKLAGPTVRLLTPTEVAEAVNSPNSSRTIQKDIYLRVVFDDGSTQVIGPRPVAAVYRADAPIYELSLASRPAAWGLTHVYCADMLALNVAGDYCTTNPFEEYWTTSFNAAPMSLHARFVPLAMWPVLGFSFDMALGMLSNINLGDVTGSVTSSDTSQKNGSGIQVTTFQASLGPDVRLTVNQKQFDVMFYVGAVHQDVNDTSRMRMTTGVALVAPLMSATPEKTSPAPVVSGETNDQPDESTTNAPTAPTADVTEG